jgi:GNAT superfamily N-acetyltransferase
VSSAVAALEWRAPFTKQDVLNVRAMRCCEPDKRSLRKLGLKEHPAEWEWTAQRVLRTPQKFPLQPPRYALIAQHEGEVIAAGYYHHEGSEARIDAVGVALDWKRKGVGTALLDHISWEIIERARAEGLDEVEVLGIVHKKNSASQELLIKNDWVIREARSGTGSRNEAEDYDVWGTTLATRTGH